MQSVQCLKMGMNFSSMSSVVRCVRLRRRDAVAQAQRAAAAAQQTAALAVANAAPARPESRAWDHTGTGKRFKPPALQRCPHCTVISFNIHPICPKPQMSALEQLFNHPLCPNPQLLALYKCFAINSARIPTSPSSFGTTYILKLWHYTCPEDSALHMS